MTCGHCPVETNHTRIRVTTVSAENSNYSDSEFSDVEVEAFMEYFKVGTYGRLKAIIATLKKSHL